MSIPETAFYQRVIRKMEGVLCLDRIENSIGSGFPDVSAAGQGRQFLIETKVSKFHEGLDYLFFERFQIAFYQRRLRYTNGKGVFIMALCNYDMDLAVYEASTIVAAPRESYKKWNLVNVNDLQPMRVVTKAFSQETMEGIAKMLIEYS